MILPPRPCLHCQQPFQPSKYRPSQVVCSRPECQRLRSREYRRKKIQIDAVYAQVVRDSQKQWWAEHPLYQKQYRQTHPEAVARNRQQQRLRDQKRRIRNLVRNTLVLDLKRSAAEVWLLGPAAGDLDRNNLASSKLLIMQSTKSASATPPAS